MTGLGAHTAAGTDLVHITLRGIDLRDYSETREHHDGLFREFAIISLDTDAASPPARLLALIDEVRDRYATFTAGPRSELLEALARGDEHVDIAFVAPRDMGESAQRFLDLLEEADEFCRRGDLLTMDTPPVAAAFRRWYLGELVRQARGDAPRPWPAVRDGA